MTDIVARLREDAEMLKDGYQKNMTELWHSDVVREAAIDAKEGAAEIERLRGLSDPTMINSKIDRAVRSLICHVVPNPDREGLEDTPKRYHKALQEWTSGYHIDTDALLKTFADGGEKYDEMVFVGSIPFYSLCEHHLATFFGVAHVAYIPSERIVGLSKIPRLVDAFARRLSVQERITTQVADALEKNLVPKGVAVCLQARHMCMESRGIRSQGSVTTTAAMRGAFKDKDHAKAEFYRMIANAKGIGLG